MGVMVVACYRPKEGREQALLDLTRTHQPILKKEGLVGDAPSLLGRAKDGTLVEVFVWKSRDAIEAAHRNAAVGALWRRYGELCDFVSIGSVSEAADMFAEFEAL